MRKKFGTGSAKKKRSPNFGLVCIHQIKIFHIFVPNLGEMYQFGNKIAFSVKLRPI